MERRRGRQDRGPHLHLKLSNEIYNRMRLVAIKRGIYIIFNLPPSPVPLLSVQTDRQTESALG